MRIEHIYRYPVKGLSREALEETFVKPACAIPWDRAFALAHGDAPFDPANPAFLPKYNFMCLLRHASIAPLRARFDPHDRVLTIVSPDGASVSENPLSEDGRRHIGAWLTDYLGSQARGTPVFHHVPGHVFGDQRVPVLSLVSYTTLAAFATDTVLNANTGVNAGMGVNQDKRRYRANVYFTGAPAWAEFGWVGRRLQLGQAILRVTKRTVRCAATEVNPDTGERDANLMRDLKFNYGHTDLGIHAEVLEGGRIAAGDAIELLN